MFAAPLMISLDLRTVNKEAKSLLQNKNLVAINQDPLGNMAIRLFEVNIRYLKSSTFAGLNIFHKHCTLFSYIPESRPAQPGPALRTTSK